MSDIVERRSRSENHQCWHCDLGDEMVAKIADLSRRLAEAGREIERLRAACSGLLSEWDKLTRYGSPIAKAANERIAFARAALTTTPPPGSAAG